MPDCACGCGRPAAPRKRRLSHGCYQRWLSCGRPPYGQIPPGRGPRTDRIDDYLFIGGDRLSLTQAARRLGVTARTISRYRVVLRQKAGAR